MLEHTKPVIQGTCAPVKCIATGGAGKFFIPSFRNFHFDFSSLACKQGEEEVWKDDFGAYVMGRLRDGVARLGIRGA